MITVESMFLDPFIHLYHLLSLWKCINSLWNDPGNQENYSPVLQDFYFSFWNTENRLNFLINSFTKPVFFKTSCPCCAFSSSAFPTLYFRPFSCGSSCSAATMPLLYWEADVVLVPRIQCWWYPSYKLLCLGLAVAVAMSTLDPSVELGMLWLHGY